MTVYLHIASLVVQVYPESLESVATSIRGSGDDVAGQDPAGKLAVVLEAPSERAIVDRIDQIQKSEGVVNALLVYHHAEPVRSLDEVIP